VRAKYPSYAVGDVAKELGKRWEACTSRAKFEQMAAKDRQRYEKVSLCTEHSCLINKLLQEITFINNEHIVIDSKHCDCFSMV